MTEEGLSAGLWIIGLGPGNLDHMSKKAINIARGCSNRYLEGYTAILPPGQEERLEEFIGSWERIMRPEVESPDKLLKLAKDLIRKPSITPKDAGAIKLLAKNLNLPLVAVIHFRP